MSDFALELAVQSYSLRNIDTTEEVIKAVRNCGLSSIELWKKHLDALECNDVGSVVKQYQDAGIRISGYGVHGFGTDEASARKVFDLARLAEFDTITGGIPYGHSQKEPLEMLERLGDEYDVNIALHNHGRKHWFGLPWFRDEVMSSTGKRIGLCIDTRWLLDTAEDPVAVTEKHFDRVYGLHLMDCVFRPDGRFQDVVLGKGYLNLTGLLKLLKARNYKGMVSFEHAGQEDPVEFIRECVEVLHKALGTI